MIRRRGLCDHVQREYKVVIGGADENPANAVGGIWALVGLGVSAVCCRLFQQPARTKRMEQRNTSSRVPPIQI
jgi:hypothetical protein